MSANTTVFLVPEPHNDELGYWFLAAIAEDPDQDTEVKDLEEAMPPLWDGKFKPHMHEIKHNDNASIGALLRGGYLATNQISHLVVLESEMTTMDGADPFYFNADKISHNSMLLWYSQARNKYYFFECRRCATVCINWINEFQEEWKAWAAPQTVH